MREMSKAMLEEAEVDLEAAKDLHATKKYARAVFFCQQALEKIAKAILDEEGHGTIIDHSVSTILSLAILRKVDEEKEKPIRDAIATMAGLEREAGKTRYPMRLRGTIFQPSIEFSEKKSSYWIERTDKAFQTLKQFIEETYTPA